MVFKKLAKKAKRKISSTARNLKTAAKAAKGVGSAAAKLAVQVANPVNIAKSVKNKGITLPGSNYIGPGNRMVDKHGRPLKTKGKGDAIAKQHDEDYDKLIKQYGAKKVYSGYSDADRRALKHSWRAAKKGDAGALAVAGGMFAKKLGSKIGLGPRSSRS